jgi:hypothetical protein
MIDPTRDELLTLPEAARTLPRLDGKRPSCTTIWRWCTKGVGPDRIRLEHIRMGRRVATTREALGRFMAATADAATERLSLPAPAIPTRRDQAKAERRAADAHARAVASLEARGIAVGGEGA